MFSFPNNRLQLKYEKARCISTKFKFMKCPKNAHIISKYNLLIIRKLIMSPSQNIKYTYFKFHQIINM